MKSLRVFFLGIMLLFATGPFYLLLKVSFSLPEEVMTPHPTLLPHGVTWQHWQHIIESGQIVAPLRLSVVVASGVAVAALLLATPAAYSLARLPLRWRYGVLVSLFLCRMLPEVALAMPIAIVFLRWGLVDTPLGLILAHLTMALPVTTWVLTTTFGTIPREVEEAAALDGCGVWQLLLRILVPLAVPGMVVGGLLAWLFSWEEFLLATYLTLAEKTIPLQVYYYLYQGNWFVTAVAAIVMTVPVLLLSALLQRYLRATDLSGVVR